MSVKIQLIEILILLVLAALGLFNMPSSNKSERQNRISAMIISAFLLYFIFIIAKIILADHFFYAGQWHFSNQSIWAFIVKAFNFVFGGIATFIGVIVLVEYLGARNR